MKVVGAVLFWQGLVILVAAAAIGWMGGTRAVDAVRMTVDEAGPMPGGTASVQFQEGDRRTIYEQTQSDFPTASCQVTGPEGGAVELSRSADAGGALAETSYINVGAFEAATTGAHTVTRTGATTVLGPSLDFDTLGSGALRGRPPPSG